jgi:hypothetical protein
MRFTPSKFWIVESFPDFATKPDSLICASLVEIKAAPVLSTHGYLQGLFFLGG